VFLNGTCDCRKAGLEQALEGFIPGMPDFWDLTDAKADRWLQRDMEVMEGRAKRTRHEEAGMQYAQHQINVQVRLVDLSLCSLKGACLEEAKCREHTASYCIL